MVVHPVVLRGAGETTSGSGPLILERSDDDAIDLLLEELSDAGGLDRARQDRASARDSAVLGLFQPVHRILNVTLVEALCDTVGGPRLDPAKIESAGLVVRRVAVDGRGRPRPDVLEAWLREAPTPRSRTAGADSRRQRLGWVGLTGNPGAPGSDVDLDPDAARRPKTLRAGHPEIDRRLMLAGPVSALDEAWSPLFVAPPDVAVATGRTVLYGIVPVTSSEQADLPTSRESLDTRTLSQHMPNLFRAGLAASLPGGATVSRSSIEKSAKNSAARAFLRDLRQIAQELDAFGAGPAAKALRVEMQKVELDFTGSGGRTQHRNAEAFLREAVDVLVAGDDDQATVQLPDRWPSIPAAQAARFTDAVGNVLEARLKTVVPRPARFAVPDRQYRLRAFVRLRSESGCPPRLIWSAYSEPFTIAEWYASGGRPPATIRLPDPFDRNALKKLKPNVAFAVPRQLANFINSNDPVDLLSGDGGKGGGLAIDWICSFSLPIITLCAFIVLNIFLGLFDLFLRWLLWVKVCIPLPKPR